MKYISIILIFLSLKSRGQETINKRTVKLLDSSKISKTKLVLLIETDSFQVLTNYKSFYTNMKIWTATHSDLKDDSLLFKYILADTIKKIINAAGIARNNDLSERLNYRIGELIEAGNCFIFNKYKKLREKTIIIVNYATVGYQGRKYFVNFSMLLDNKLIIY
ncbi:MAG: hypothetical protein SGJ10_03180 [Bacteroidota bacterium]|nr:hypothetical protein [Bacteroidota bacterium]